MNLEKIIQTLIPNRMYKNLKNYKQKLRLYKYQGKGVICPVCSKEFKIFEPFGSPRRRNSKCPYCKSLERQRLLWKYLNEKTDYNLSGEKRNLLHFAPEIYFYQKFSRNERIVYFPVDLFPELYNYEGQTKVKKADIINLPFEDNYFDIILCSHVLEHVIDDAKAMSELFRVLKPGGWGIFQVPINYKEQVTYEDFSITSEAERTIHFGQHDHVRFYGKDFSIRLSKVGFKVKEDNYIQSMTPQEQFKFGLDKNEIVYFCSK